MAEHYGLGDTTWDEDHFCPYCEMRIEQCRELEECTGGIAEIDVEDLGCASCNQETCICDELTDQFLYNQAWRDDL